MELQPTEHLILNCVLCTVGMVQMPDLLQAVFPAFATFPSGQEQQALFPVDSLTLLSGQGVQTVSPGPLYSPAAHRSEGVRVDGPGLQIRLLFGIAAQVLKSPN